jgi:hypothetical protein
VSESSNQNNGNIKSGSNLNYVIAPKPIVSEGTPKPEINTNPKKRRGFILGAIGAVAAATIAVPVWIGIASEHGSQGAKPPKAIESSAPTNPSEAPSVTPEVIPTVESLKLDPALINNPEELTKTVDNTLTQWINSGSGESNAKPAMESADYTAYAANIASGYDDVYKKALLPDNWESNQSLLDWIHNASTIHAQTLAYNYGTTPSLKIDSANKEAYTAGYKYVSFDGAVTNPDKSVTITDTSLPYDNSKQNSLSQHTLQAVDGKEIRTSTTYAVINGELKIIGKT